MKKFYFIGMFGYGFFRGFSDTINISFNQKTKLEYNTSKFFNGIYTASLFLNPVFHPFIIYHFILRTEKRILGDPLKKEDFDW